MKALPADTVRLITSSQVITSVFSVVKELVENSLDANATNIDIKLDNYGFDRIEIRDDGDGIPLDNVAYMGQHHFTSKMTQMSDLHQLITYGFRGEALASLCAVSSVTIATKTDEDPISMVYTLDQQGKVAASKPCHLGKGTTVTAVNLFKNTPVRKQFFSNAKRRKDELRKVEELMMQYAVIKPQVRIMLRNDKTIVLHKNKAANHKAALGSVWGRNVIGAMDEISIDIGNAKAECFLPKPEADFQLISRSSNDRCWVFVNGRPVSYKQIEKIFKQCVLGCYQTQSSGRYPFAFVSISLPPDAIDVNLEPNKTKVLLQEKESILEAIEAKLQIIYQTGSKEKEEITNHVCQSNGSDNNIAEYGSDVQASDRMMAKVPTRMTVPQDHSLDASKDVFPSDRMTQGSVRMTQEDHSLVISRDSDSVMLNSNQLMSQGLLDRARLPQELPTSNLGLGSNRTMPQDVPPDTSSTVPYSNGLIEDSQIGDNQTMLDSHCMGAIDKEMNIDSHKSVDNIPQTSNVSMFSKIECKSEVTDRALKNIDSDPIKTSGAVPVIDPLKAASSFPINVTPAVENTEFDLISTELTDSELMDFLETKSDITDTSLSESTIDGILESANQIAAAEWSKGNGLVDELGRPIEPGKILVPNRNISNQNLDDSIIINKKENADLLKAERNIQTPCREKKPIQERMGQATFYNLVGRTPIKRPQTAYIFFSKEIRPQIIKDNPTADFQTISKLTGDRWRELTDDEKSKFEDLTRQDVVRYKEQVKEAKKNGIVQEPMRKKKCIKAPPQQMLVDKLFSPPRRASTTTKPVVKSVDVSFSCAGLKVEKQNRQCCLINTSSEPHERLSLIGQLSTGFWICKDGDQLQVLNHCRVEESLLYHRLLAEHRLQIQQLTPPITLSPSMIGGYANWQTLMTLKSNISAVDGTRTFIDERLVANGFEIKQTEDTESGNVRIQVVGMATNIPYYGLADLAQLLDLIGSSTNGSVSLHESRPVKLTHYLQGEAVRLARDRPHRSTHDDIVDMMDRQRAMLPPNIQSCIHDKPFLQTLHRINVQ